MTARQAVRAEAIQPPSAPSSSEERTAGDGMVGTGPGSRAENGGDEEAKTGDYATVAVGSGCF